LGFRNLSILGALQLEALLSIRKNMVISLSSTRILEVEFDLAFFLVMRRVCTGFAHSHHLLFIVSQLLHTVSFEDLLFEGYFNLLARELTSLKGEP